MAYYIIVDRIIPAFLGESYFNDRSYALTKGQTPERRELDYLRYLGASDETAKEIKISPFRILLSAALGYYLINFISTIKNCPLNAQYGELFSQFLAA